MLNNVYISLSFTFFNINVNEVPIWILDVGFATEVHSGQVPHISWVDPDPV